jgi:hypothetical protein
MKTIEFPLVISPNLGCPRIFSLEGLKKGETIPLIIAGLYGEFKFPLRDAFEGILYLRLSYSQGKRQRGTGGFQRRRSSRVSNTFGERHEVSAKSSTINARRCFAELQQ